MATELMNIRYTVNGVSKAAVGEVIRWDGAILRFVDQRGRVLTVAARNVKSVKPVNSRVLMEA